MQRKKTGKLGAILAALVVICGLLFWMLPVLFLIFSIRSGGCLELGLLIYLIVPVIIGGGVIAALVQRLREIRQGEEDEASKY